MVGKAYQSCGWRGLSELRLWSTRLIGAMKRVGFVEAYCVCERDSVGIVSETVKGTKLREERIKLDLSHSFQ